MSTGEVEGDAVRKELEDVLKSPGFARNERLSGFLRFIVERHLEGRDRELKESVIGIEVFGRQPDYNPKSDPVVRMEARRLRARLVEYYQGPGVAHATVIDVPKGGYVPAIRTNTQSTAPAGAPARFTRRWIALAFVGLAIILAAVSWTRLWPHRQFRPIVNSAAYEIYLRARAFEMRPGAKGVEVSLELFEQAAAKDSSFAPAYGGVAAMEAVRSAFDRFNPSERAAMIAKGWVAAEKAIELDPRLPDAHDGLGMMQARNAQWKNAERSFRRAIELGPNDPLWRDHFAMFVLLPLGRTEEAVKELRTAEESDAQAQRQTHYALSLALRALGRFDDAEFHCHRAAEDDQQMSSCWGETLLRQGKAQEAIRTLEAAWSAHQLRMGVESLGVAYARAGRVKEAEHVAAVAPRPASKALVFAALGDRERTLQMLDQMVPMGPTRIGRDLIGPEYAFLRSDPRLKALRQKVGLPE
jgi:Flp pilus assembly protein TadD